MGNLTIATEIKRQLLTLGKMKVWSWGAHAWIGGDNFLHFKVNGLKHKGYIKITLNGMDLYDIQFFKKKNAAVISEKLGIFFDDLVDVIDIEVEIGNDTKEEYRQNIELNALKKRD